jgi:hypothetical protein
MIEGNLFSLLGNCTAIRFPSDREAQPSIQGIEIGMNSNRCPTYLAGFDDTMGRAASVNGSTSAGGRLCDPR